MTRQSTWAVLFLLCCAAAARAQQPSAQGPLVLEPMNNGFVAAPDVKFTKLNGEIATLAGGYGAWVHDDHLLIGGAGYFRADKQGDHNFGYGGLEAGWIFLPSDRLSVTAKGLVGFGQVTVPLSIADGDCNREFNRCVPRLQTPAFREPTFPGRAFRFHRDFFVAEPEVDVKLGLARRISLVGGVSYRAVDLPDGLDTLARGAAGSVGVQFKIGK